MCPAKDLVPAVISEEDKAFPRIILAVLVLAFTLAAGVPLAAGATGSFISKSEFSHRLSDDPIIYPGQPGASQSNDSADRKVELRRCR